MCIDMQSMPHLYNGIAVANADTSVTDFAAPTLL